MCIPGFNIWARVLARIAVVATLIPRRVEFCNYVFRAHVLVFALTDVFVCAIALLVVGARCRWLRF